MRHSSGPILAHADEENSGAVGGRDRLFRFRNHGAAGRDGNASKTRPCGIFNGLRANRRQIEAPVLTRISAP